MIESFIIIDLEWNTCRIGEDKFLNEIIEIGAVKLDRNLNIVDTFQVFVKPTFGEHLTSMVKKLTHIKNDDLINAPTFKEAYGMFCLWAKKADVLLSFGTSDILVMLENFKIHGMPLFIKFIDGYADMQLFCQNQMQIDTYNMLGLTHMAEKLEININDMSMHRALDDCKVSAKCFKALYGEEELKKYISENTPEFYAKIQFKNFYTTDLSITGLNKSELHQKCPECGCYLKRFEAWNSKYNSLRATMICGNCGKEYLCKIRLRIEYEGAKVKSALSPLDKNLSAVGQE